MICPVKFRAFLYVLISGLPVPIMFFTAYVDKLSKGEIPLTHWAVWVLLGLNTSAAIAIALRAYYDGSAERASPSPVSKPTETEPKP
jgi:hypothetical protein